MGFNSHGSNDYSIKDSVANDKDYTANWIKKHGGNLLKMDLEADHTNT